jgi:hypothetical protein
MKSKYYSFIILSIALFVIWGCQGGGEDVIGTQVSTEATADVSVPTETVPVETLDETDTQISMTAFLSELEGEVIAKQVDENDFYEVSNGFVLNSLGQVSTGYESRVRLDISDGSIVRLGANAIFTLDYGKKTSEGTNTKLELNLGQIWVILKGGSIDIETESGLASVRGSFLGLSVGPNGEVYLTCFEGDCYIATALGVFHFSAGETILATGLFVDPIPGYMTQEEIDAFMEINPEALAAYAAHQAAVDTNEPDDDFDGVSNTDDQCPDEGDIGWGVDDVGCRNTPPVGDADSDGVQNSQDDCPLLGDLGYGVDTSGCPNPPADQDGDGYPDVVDACPDDGDAGYGLDAGGCPRETPDDDGDGVLNEDDACPDYGDEGHGVDDVGCPNQPPGADIDFDVDNDGVPNNVDKCPSRGDAGYGLKPNGCPKPVKDSDGDGLNDDEDACPDESDQGFGLSATGCPYGPPSPTEAPSPTEEPL